MTGRALWLKVGRFGPYVELAADPDDPKAKPKRGSLPKGWPPASIDLEKGLRLINLPREVGLHPEDGQPILAGIGRYGPYVQHAGTYANLADADEVFEVGLNRAVAVLAEKRAGGGRGGRSAPAALVDLGDGLKVMSGRFGPYVTDGKTNANIPKGQDPAALTREQAEALIAERAAKGGGKKPARKAKAAPKAAAKKKASAKKVTAKKKG